MSYKYSTQAAAELRIALVTYLGQGGQTGQRFESAVDTTVAAILANPLMFPELDPPYRFASAGVFPYTLVYKIEPSLIHIVGVIHTSLGGHPWRGRV